MRIKDCFLKTVFILSALLALRPISNAQNELSLVFTGVDQHNEYVRINSVTIENLTREWSETILFPDTVYTLEFVSGVEDYLEEGKMQVMPNPFDGHTWVNIFSAHNEPVKMVMVDINGRKCAEFTGILAQGDNYFEISLTTPQVYVLSVTTSSGMRSLKMVNKGHGGADRITADGHTGAYAKVDIKSTFSQEFELGDEMRYIGFASHNGHQIQSEVVTQQQFVSETFELRFQLESEIPMAVVTDSVMIIGGLLHCYGTVLSGEAVTTRGFCWSTSPHPTLANDYTVDGSGLGGFSNELAGLNSSQYYFLRAYATNNDGTIYGNEYRFRINSSYVQIDTVFIPDGIDCGEGCSYVSTMHITDYAESATIQSAEDIGYVRVKLEHSFVGDIWIKLICPNQQYVSILRKYNSSQGPTACASQIPVSEWGWNDVGASSSFFGQPYDNSSGCDPNYVLNAMGIPWNYCWSNATNLGYVYSDNYYVYSNASIGVSIDSTDVANMTNVYHPDVSFANLFGCPINGFWSIEVMDGWNSDNGWMTEWELMLNIAPPVDTVQPEVVTVCPGMATVMDYDGNAYNTVQIGNQCWMKENLRTTHYASGEPISLSSSMDPAVAQYYLPEVTDSAMACGYLYNWKAVMGQGGGGATNQGICPPGWHVPSDAEWTQLTDYMGGLSGYVCGDNPNNIAKALASETEWNTSLNSCAVGNDLSSNNTSGFSAMPVGYACGTSMDYGTSARFWTANSSDNNYAHYRALNYDNGFVEPNSFGDKACGLSVRCILAEVAKVTTAEVSGIMDSTAVCGGEVISVGGANVTERGLCWSTKPYPTINDSHIACGIGLGSFSFQMTGLTPATTYYVRAYATNAAGTVYGSQVVFTTMSIPVVETYNVTDIIDTIATCGGSVSFDGGVPVLARGVCWSTGPSPTLSDNHTTDGSGTGDFSSQLTGLIPGTLYRVRAYATNSFGTAYGAQQSFTTKSIPSVTLNSITDVLSITAICSYRVTANGGMDLIERGICYSTVPNPTLNDSVLSGPDNSGSLQLSGLIPGTTYYVRAYATNGVGTGYSNEIAFTTLTIPTVNTSAMNDVSYFTATGGGEVLATSVPEITARGVCWSTSQNPTIAGDHTVDSSGFGTFASQLTGLNLHTTYYVRAYATNSSGTGYGNVVTFTTLNIPTVTTNAVTNVLDSTATCGGKVTNDGGGTLLTKGICWSTLQQPTIDDNIATDTSALANYTCSMTGLTPATKYYVRAFATNGGGTAYGQQKSFTTKALPTVTLDSATNILSLTASCTYHVVDNGGFTVTSRGICYSISPNPTLGDSVITGTSSVATLQLTGLIPGTSYYVRAYATNSIGTAYSNEISFTTLTIPSLTTAEVSDIDFFTATGGGEVLTTAVPQIIERGVCWSTFQNPTIADNHSVDSLPADSIGFGIFTSQMTNLSPSTTYYVKAYAINSSGIGYGNQVNFTTLQLPTVSTKNITNITDSSATCGGNVSSIGGDTLIARGICWSIESEPTVSNAHTCDSINIGTGNFTSVMTGLTSGITYYVRAYATNRGGTAYGNQRSFTTKGIPTVTLDSAINILSVTASCTYHVVSTGGLSLSSRGVCFSNAPNTTLDDSVITGTSNAATVHLTGLTSGVTYYVRAFAINSMGTAYSNQISFTTLSIPTVTTALITDVSFFTATCGGEVISTGVPEITARGVCWSTLSNPTVNDNITTDSLGFGSFTSQLTGLSLNTTYHVRAYATNSFGTGYGEEVTFTTLELPSVNTLPVTFITDTSAKSGIRCFVTSAGDPTAMGICWGTSPNPTVDDFTSEVPTNYVYYEITMTDLTPGSTYYVRAFATNGGGTVYGDEFSFLTPQPCPDNVTITDIDNNTYRTVLIGSQCWMKENLRVTHFPDGAEIPIGTVDSTPSRYYPYEDSSNVLTYGYLYNWPAVIYGANNSENTAAGIQGVCPDGWHVPSSAEWITLSSYLSINSRFVCGGDNSYIAKALAAAESWSETGTGTNECSIGYYNGDNNTTGFSALNAGQCYISNSGYDPNIVYSTPGITIFSSTSWSSDDFMYAFYFGQGSRQPLLDTYSKYNGLSVRCLRNDSVNWLPTVTTDSIVLTTYTSATINGDVTDEGAASVIAKGFCWGTYHNPTIYNSFHHYSLSTCDYSVNGYGTGSFSSVLTDLQPLTTYYVRTYATNEYGTMYGDEISFVTLEPNLNPNDGQPCLGFNTVTDFDNNVYNTVQIGGQCWMKENLRTTHYANGVSIPTSISNSSTIPYRYAPNNDTNNVFTYGFLYNWPAVMNGSNSSTSNPSGVQGICPTGWHVPSSAEFTELIQYTSSQSVYWCDGQYSNIVKALSDTSGWVFAMPWASDTICFPGINQNTNNATGFTLRPAGMRTSGDAFRDFGTEIDLWSTTLLEGYSNEYPRVYEFYSSSPSSAGISKGSAFSVRCLRD